MSKAGREGEICIALQYAEANTETQIIAHRHDA